jgi:hypothetical protein
MKECGLCHAVAALTPAEDLILPVGQEARWALELVWTCCEENMLCDHRFSRPDLFHHKNPHYLSVNIVSLK